MLWGYRHVSIIRFVVRLNIGSEQATVRFAVRYVSEGARGDVGLEQGLAPNLS